MIARVLPDVSGLDKAFDYFVPDSLEAMIEAREAKGAFTSLSDFCKKVDQRRVNRRVIEALHSDASSSNTASTRNWLR